ncbi:hypothetical protein ACKC9G_06240 [Pokkaliibacter sp. CJK22405]|uniref:hypothetical protein n=1 Tax=Pokkaliibacter sp. CJK22405 TaxID=3384615 RepID=UPI003984D35D
MNSELKELSVVELLDRADLSNYTKTEVIRMRAEAERAELIAEGLTAAYNAVVRFIPRALMSAGHYLNTFVRHA